MELSIVERLSPELLGPQAESPPGLAELKLFEIPVPQELHHLGRTVRACALGDPRQTPLVLLGGISADCFPALRPDGSEGWWSRLVRDGGPIDARNFYVIGIDFAADDSGNVAPSTDEQALVVAAALDSLAINRAAVFVGASYGGMVALALAANEPHRVDRLVLVCAADRPHPASTASRELQRRIVSLGLRSGRGEEALGIARGMAMLTYRTPEEFELRFDGGIDESSPLCCSGPGAYLRARGLAFSSVMSPGRFLSLSGSIDRHAVDPSRIKAPCLVIGATSDQLVFAGQLRELASRLTSAELHLLDSLYGHDLFLKDAERVGALASAFLSARAS